ncbi:MAG: hypothetical protein ACE5OZ_04305 [Candidatus Heimdallarchaeota archaeon]
MTKPDQVTLPQKDSIPEDEEWQRTTAAETVLRRWGLYIYDQLRTEDDVTRHWATLALWRNTKFVAEFEAAVQAELKRMRSE